MAPHTQGTIEWLAEELMQAKLLERGTVQQLLGVLRREFPYGDANALGEYLVQIGILTPYQVKRAVEGDARKLVIGPYMLMDPIGTGGMGTVHRAMGRSDKRHYVVKLLPLRNQWNVRLARKQIEHFDNLPPQDGIVPFVDVGTANGRHYLVWPFVEGKPLEARVGETGPLPSEEAARLGAQIALTLELCHGRDIVHGFVKPTNVMIGFDGKARLLDFGIGAILADNSDELDSLIDTYATAHTTASMLECAAPELVLEPSQLTPLCDQYSLGCVLYFALTGSYPFPDGTAMDKVYCHQKRTPTPIAHLAPGTNPELIAIIERMMSKAPEDRFRRWRDPIDHLAALSGGGSSTALVPPPVPVDVQTPLPSKVFRKRDLVAETPRPARSPAPLLEAEIIREEKKDQPKKKRGWFGKWFGGE
jgi:serine/threonine protein kinase